MFAKAYQEMIPILQWFGEFFSGFQGQDMVEKNIVFEVDVAPLRKGVLITIDAAPLESMHIEYHALVGIFMPYMGHSWVKNQHTTGLFRDLVGCDALAERL